MATPKEHIEEIRRTKFSIGGNPNPLKIFIMLSGISLLNFMQKMSISSWNLF
ncbi:hypothetical protein A2U01_0103175, partial [Trifolium medium]|nr:hypothetical protein [Trifolium medium]